MADIRIKDLATTASSAASDDFMALDGVTNGTRKMSAANPSVTTLTTSGVITPGGSVHGANGSAANPSFAFNSDQNTGLYRIGADNIGVAVGGVKVLDVASTGLTVTGALGASSLTSPVTTDLTLGTGTFGTALTVASATGYVGIGTVSPAVLLDIKAPNAESQIRLTSTTGTNANWARFTNTGGNFYIGQDSSTGLRLNSVSLPYAGTMLTDGVYPLSFGTNNVTRMIIGSTGNVGIGSITPAAKLSIVSSSATNGKALILRNPNGSTNSSVSIDLETSAGTEGEEGAMAGRFSGIRLASGTSGALAFSTNNGGVLGERMRIDNLGTVSISSTTAGSSGAGALVVQGGISAGNTGSAASYFGGAVTVTGAVTTGGVLETTSTTAGTSDSVVVARFQRGTSGTAANNIGGFIQLLAEDNAGLQREAGLISWKLTSVDVGSPAGSVIIGTRNSNNALAIDDTGAATFAGSVTTSSTTLSGAGAIPITTSLVKFTSTGAANALTLANGVDGQRLTIVHDVKGTLGTGVLTPTTKTGFTTVTFTNAGDTVSLVYVTTRGWMVTGSYLATIA